MSETLDDRRQEDERHEQGWRPFTRCADFPAGWYERTCLRIADEDAPLRYARGSASSATSAAAPTFSTTQ